MGDVGVEITLAGDVTIRPWPAGGTAAVAARRLRGTQVAVAFAALTLERRQGIDRDALADIVWPDGLPATWPSALRSLVSRVRDFVAPVVPGGRAALAVEAGRHWLHLAPGTVVDVETAERTIEATRSLLASGEPDQAWAAATGALTCLRAPFLPGHHGPWVEGRRRHTAELLVAGLELASRAAIDRGDGTAALVAANDAVGRAPLRESAHRCVMLAHAAAGNRGEALRAYQRLRRALADELGVDPAPATEEVYLDLLGRPPAPPPRSSRTRPANGRADTPTASTSAGDHRPTIDHPARPTERWTDNGHDRPHRGSGGQPGSRTSGPMASDHLQGADQVGGWMDRGADGQTQQGADHCDVRPIEGTHGQTSPERPHERAAPGTDGRNDDRGDRGRSGEIGRSRHQDDASGVGERAMDEPTTVEPAARERVTDGDPGKGTAERTTCERATDDRTAGGGPGERGAGEPATAGPGEPATAEAATAERAMGERAAGEQVVSEGRGEAGELEEAWRRARGGRPTVVLVTGPAGAGKSALAAGAARRVTAEGGLVLFGGCDPAGPTAYGPFVEAFDGLLAATPDDDRALATPGTRTALGQLLRARDTTSDPVLLAGGLAEVLGGLTTARPAMVVLDDLQWAGAGACRLLEHLVRRAGHLGVLFVAIARDDLSPAHPLHGTAAALEHEDWLWRVPLAGADSETATRTATSGLLSPGRLPVHATSFVGREAECDQALAALRAGRLVTLVGTGGVGKTRLAVEIVRRARLADHPDGVRFCDVAALGDPAGLVHHVAAAVGLGTSRWGPAEARRELAAAVGASRLLLVLDGCEHVRAAVAELAGELLATSTASSILATSRAPLRTRDEWVVAVAPLPVPTAVRLLVDRARAAGTTVAGDDPALAEIARRLDGLPLALELAAPRLATLAPGDLAADLRRTFDLVGQAASGPLRQRTLQATVEWSWTLLGRPARRLLTALSVFRGGWTFDGARAVAPAVGVAPTAVPALLAELADQSMVRPESPHAAHGHPHSHDALSTYRMLGAVAAYAAERLAVSSDHRAVAEHHAIHVVALAEQALAHRRGPAEPAWVRRVELGFDDLRAACRWSIDTDRPVLGLRLVAALAEDVMLRDRLEVGRWAEELAALPAVRNEPLRAVALGVAGTTAVAEDRLDDALRLGTAALDAERATGAPPCWLSRNVLALLAAVGRAGEASDEILGDVVLELDGIARSGEDPIVLALLLHQYVLAYAFAGQASEGVDAANELLALGREHPSPTIRAMGLLSHGLAVADGDPDLAARQYRAALDLATSARTTTLVQRAERALQELHARSSDSQATLGALRALLARRAPSDNLSEQIQTVVAMLDALVALGDLRSAATICGGLAHTPWQQGSTSQRADAAAARDLPPDHYHAARSAGAAMSSPELIAFAHSRADELVRARAHSGTTRRNPRRHRHP